MTLFDWLIVLIPSLVVAYVTNRVARYVTGTSDFLTAGRSAGAISRQRRRRYGGDGIDHGRRRV